MNYIGIDGGGTKTKMVLYSEDGTVIKELILPTVHILSQDRNQCIKILKEGLDTLDPKCNTIVGAGLAGYGQQQELRDKITEVLKEASYPRKFVLDNDVTIAMKGALNGEDGIVVIAGTGSIGLSIIDSQVKRCGGWGYQLGDEGSGYWVVKKMLDVFCRQIDGRLERTKLYDLIMQELKLEHDYDIISYMHNLNHDRTKIASLAYITSLAAKENDIYALNIYQEAAKELANIILLLAKDFDTKVKVSYIGGVFVHTKQYLLPTMNDILKDKCELIDPIYPPEYGAYMLARGK